MLSSICYVLCDFSGKLLFVLELYVMENVTGLYAGSLQEKIEGKKYSKSFLNKHIQLAESSRLLCES